MKRIFFVYIIFFSSYCFSGCGDNESTFSCFVGPSVNPVHLGSDGLYHMDYYCSDMVSSYYSPDNKGRLSGEWHNVGPSKNPSCDFYEKSNRLSLQSQVENCIYWKNHNIEAPEKYHCRRLLNDN